MTKKFINQWHLNQAIVVCRHPGAIDWIAQQLHNKFHKSWYQPHISSATIEWHTLGIEGGEEVLDSIPLIRGNASDEQVRGKIVIGVLPFHLAAEAVQVYAIEFGTVPPRGTEYSAKDMENAGARLTSFRCERGYDLNIMGC